MKVSVLIQVPDRERAVYAFETIFDVLGLSARVSYRFDDEPASQEEDIIIIYGHLGECSAVTECLNRGTAVVHVPVFDGPLGGKPRKYRYLRPVASHLPDVPVLEYLPIELLDEGEPLYRLAEWEGRKSAAITLERSGEGFIINFGYDIIQMVFSLISCERECALEREGRWINSRFQGLGEDPRSARTAAVNRSIQLIGSLIDEICRRKRIPYIKKGGMRGKKFIICLTHDVDAVDKSFREVVKHVRHSAYRMAVHLKSLHLQGIASELRTLIRIVARKSDYCQFEKVLALEREHGVSSSFYFTGLPGKERAEGSERDSARRWRDPVYRVDSPKLRQILRDLQGSGAEIGLHGSYGSFDSAPMLASERAMLEEVLGTEVLGGRQHFLRFSVLSTWRIQEEIGLSYDTSLGFRDINGFRAGTAFPFHPYDHEARGRLSILEIPLAIMDGVAFDRDFRGFDSVWQDMEDILASVRDTGGAASVLWHQRLFDEQDFPRRAEFYHKVLDWIGQNEGCGCSCGELVDWWQHRASLIFEGISRRGETVEWTYRAEMDSEEMFLTLNLVGVPGGEISCEGADLEVVRRKDEEFQLVLRNIEAGRTIRVCAHVDAS